MLALQQQGDHILGNMQKFMVTMEVFPLLGTHNLINGSNHIEWITHRSFRFTKYTELKTNENVAYMLNCYIEC